MTVRPEVVALLTGHDPEASSQMDLRYVRHDGTPYTTAEIQLVASATLEELEAAAAVAAARGAAIQSLHADLARLSKILGQSVERHGNLPLGDQIARLAEADLAEAEQIMDRLMPGWR
jgi:hypothetical protein